MSAKVHKGDSIKKAKNDKRTVYKNVLDSPFALKWPSMKDTQAKKITETLLSSIEPIGCYRKALQLQKKSSKEAKTKDIKPPVAPDILNRVHIGINQVTRHLETLIKNKSAGQPPATSAVFVCKRDANPPHLCTHLLSMCALADIKIVSLPPDTEPMLAGALGIRRACAIAVEVKKNKEESLRLELRAAHPVHAPWLKSAIAEPHVYYPTNIKTLETTAPITAKSQKRKPDQMDQNEANKKAKK